MNSPTAFVAHSFAADDAPLVARVTEALQEMGMVVLTGERSDAKGVAEKVRERIERAGIFVGLLTRRYPIPASSAYTTSAWVVEEKGYFLGQGVSRPIVLLVEQGVPVPGETGGIGGDLEYFPFNRYDFDAALDKLREALTPVPRSRCRE